MFNKPLEADLGRPQICPNPVFIIGSPRSGTSILAWSLAQHSKLWTSAESDFLYHLFGEGHLDNAFEVATSRTDESWLHKERVGKSEFCGFVGLGFNALFTSRSGGKRWIDQTPLYTLIVDLLAEMFPGALFLHILRDGRRVVHSMTHFENALRPEVKAAMAKAGRLPPWVSKFCDACISWSEHVRVAMEFCASFPSRCLTVKNEDLVASPQKAFGRIFDFLGVAYEEAPIKHLQSRRINSSFPQESSSKPPDVGPASNPWHQWSADQKNEFIRYAGPALIQSGFAQTNELALSDEERQAISDYEKGLLQVSEEVLQVVPGGARVLVVSKGDEALVMLKDRTAEHFPQTEEGIYAGYNPADSAEAISHLEGLRAKGADYIVFPATSLWWLEYYEGFREYLESHFRLASHSDECRIYCLQKAGVPSE